MHARLAIAAAALILVGQGCPSYPSAVPTGPEKGTGAPAQGEAQKSATATMMEQEQQGEAMKSATGAEMQREGEAMREKKALAPTYGPYSMKAAEDAFGEGRAVVYYFYAAWCPICRAEEPKIEGWIEASGLPVAGFRVDYDSEKALKATYRIPYQHTTVFLDASGREVERFNGPVDEATFRAALEKATGS